MLEETIKVRATCAYEYHILTPKLTRYMLSSIRCLLQLPVGRLRVEKDLSSFICAYLMHGPSADMTYIEDESEKDDQKRVEDGVQLMNTWDWGNIKGEARYLAIAERAFEIASISGR